MTHRQTIGIMTGNSMDAADAVLVEFGDNNACRLLATARTLIEPDLAETLRGLAEADTISVTHLLQAQNALTEVCATAAKQLNANTANTVIGCHGQTIAHRPKMQATWQLLNGALLAKQTGMDVICDFRSRDVAAGGEGAPFAPLFHQHLFAPHTPCDVVNIGGIANITHLRDDSVSGYDTGPGMMLLDAFYHQQTGERFDVDGRFAASGEVCQAWLTTLLQHPFFHRPPPKSCGREAFALSTITPPPNLATADIQATLLALTAQTIAAAVSASSVYLCGGGCRNTPLVGQLKGLEKSVNWRLTDENGVPVEYMEAMVFAWLAKTHIDGQNIITTPITGGKPHIAGARYPA